MKWRVFCFILSCALLPFMSMKLMAFEVTAKITASVVSDIGTTPTIICYVYAIGTETNKPDRSSYASTPGVYNSATKIVTCSPKLNYTFSEIGKGVELREIVAFKVVISVSSVAGYRTLVPFAGQPTVPQNSTVIDLPAAKGIKI